MGGEAGRCNTAAEPSQTWIKRPTKPVGIHQTLKLGRAYTVKPSPPSRSGQLVIPASNLREESLSIRRSESFPSVRLHLFQLSSGNTRAHEFRTSFSYLLRILKIRTILYPLIFLDTIPILLSVETGLEKRILPNEFCNYQRFNFLAQISLISQGIIDLGHETQI